jgi:hypothetical protein
MTSSGSKIRSYVLVFVTVAMIAVSAKVTYDHALHSIRVAFAEDQTEILEEMRAKALRSNPSEAVDFLEYATNYYPSGTKQVQDSRLDRIVERARDRSVREILADLRVKTGKDLGSDPQKWIEAYQKGH